MKCLGSFNVFLERQSYPCNPILNCRALWHHRRLQVQKGKPTNKQAAASSYTKAAKNMKQVLDHSCHILQLKKKTYETEGAMKIKR